MERQEGAGGLISDERPLTKEEIMILEALIRSPAWAILARLYRMKKTEALYELASCESESRMRTLQGQIQAFNIVENFPVQFGTLIAGAIHKKDEAEKKKRGSARA
jgi:Ser/Thr protein kinase RdoA (MazF antagonist)